jgi:hypothetical protein
VTGRHRHPARARHGRIRIDRIPVRSPWAGVIIGAAIFGVAEAGIAGVLLLTQQPASAATPVPVTVCYAAATGPCMGWAP